MITGVIKHTGMKTCWGGEVWIHVLGRDWPPSRSVRPIPRERVRDPVSPRSGWNALVFSWNFPARKVWCWVPEIQCDCNFCTVSSKNFLWSYAYVIFISRKLLGNIMSRYWILDIENFIPEMYLWYEYYFANIRGIFADKWWNMFSSVKLTLYSTNTRTLSAQPCTQLVPIVCSNLAICFYLAGHHQDVRHSFYRNCWTLKGAVFCVVFLYSSETPEVCLQLPAGVLLGLHLRSW